jgi:hypothetical protein
VDYSHISRESLNTKYLDAHLSAFCLATYYMVFRCLSYIHTRTNVFTHATRYGHDSAATAAAVADYAHPSHNSIKQQVFHYYDI